MKKLITVLMMSLAIMGCEESGGPAASTTKAPVITAPIADEPVIDPVPVDTNTIRFELSTTEPTQYQIVIYKWIDNVGYDTNPFLVMSGTTSSNTATESAIINYRCKVLIFKQETTSPSEIKIKRQNISDYVLQISSAYWIHEGYFN
jgi:hypothetical protein